MISVKSVDEYVSLYTDEAPELIANVSIYGRDWNIHVNAIGPTLVCHDRNLHRIEKWKIKSDMKMLSGFGEYLYKLLLNKIECGCEPDKLSFITEDNLD
jgi:hypothetical protein